ncbi:MAG: DNA polymerase III subunit beta [Planctomycetes bacterium]|nr:DNA polymerase III subunit beta [Planctomycetota bacterium]
MKIRCDRLELADRLNSIVGIIPLSTPKPILINFYLATTESGSLLAEASDLEVTGRVFIHKVEMVEPGEMALPSGRIISILKEIPEDTVSLHSIEGGQGALLESNGFEFKILGHDPAEFPRAREPENLKSISLRREKLFDSLRRVAVATSKDPTRYQLNGIYLELEPGRIAFTATDGKRLTNDWFQIDNPEELTLSVIVPNKAVDAFIRILSSPLVQDENVLLSFSDTQVTLKTKDTHLASALVSGIYPNYRLIFPPEPKLKIRANRHLLLSAARGASLTTDKESQTVYFKVAPEGLVLQATGKSVGESRIRIPVEVMGEPMELRFGPVYFIDALRTFEDDEIIIEFTEPGKPAVIKGSQNYRHLVMPLVEKRV